MQRPRDITILAVLSAIVGVLGLLGSLALIGSGLAGGILASEFGTLGVIGGLIILLVGSVLNLVFAYGAWNLSPWAWMLGLIGEGLALGGAVAGILSSRDIGTQQIVNIVIPAIIIYYLMTPEVKKAFGRA
jgi:uncharacterized membrane protein (DUF2068 family)